jgi:riboflavin kinase / FMN adenylyltransferase
MTFVARGLGALETAPSVVTIGNFDGVHRGHQVLLRRAATLAAQHDVRSVAVTFDPHPAVLLRAEAAPPRLQTLDDRIDALVDAGLDAVLILPFTRELASSTPAGFVSEVLAGSLAAVRVVVGTNFRFGAKAAGDVVTLVELGEEYGFAPEAVTLLELDGRRISSSAIREHLQDGDLSWATAALGRPYELAGTVVQGDGRGRGIGFPTANLALDPDLMVPGAGVYAGYARWGAAWRPAVTNVGIRPTFDGTTRTVEVHLLDVDEELYGRTVRFRFLHRLRAERRFDGVDALVTQIRADVLQARQLLGEG